MQGHTTKSSNQSSNQNSTNIIFVLRHGLRKEFLGLYLKRFSTLPLPWRSNTLDYIARNRRIRLIGILATFSLILLSVATIAPLTNEPQYTEAATGTAQASVVTISDVVSASMDLSVDDINGTFTTTDTGPSGASTTTSGTRGSFKVTTNNVSGYYLTIKASDDTGQLVNSEASATMNSISSHMTASTFNSAGNNGLWGFKPSKYMTSPTASTGTDNTSTTTGIYLPAPTTAGVPLDKTVIANPSTANSYTIDLAARLQYTQASGNYTKTFIITATGNPVTYSITFSDNSGDSSVVNLPARQYNDEGITNTTIQLTNSTPTRTGYTFTGWCSTETTNSGTTCNGESTPTYTAGGNFGIDQTTENNTTLYAVWTPNLYTCTKQYRLQNADGSWGNWQDDTSEQVAYQSTCNYSKSVTDYKGSESGSNGSSASTSGTMNSTSGITLQLSFYRNTYTLTVSAGTNTSNATGGGTYRWGQTATVGVTKATDTTCISYATPTWTATAGTAPSAGTSVSYTMPKSNATITATSTSGNIAQEVTLVRGTGVNGITIANAKYTSSSVSLNCGTYDISGNYDSGYEFSSWSRADNVTVASTSTASTTMTVSGAGTLTLNAKSSCSSSISGTMQNFNPSTLCSGVTSGTLTDSRDNQTYTVAKINGSWWMTRNLAIGCAGSGSTYSATVSSKTLTSSNSNVSSSWSTPTALLSTKANSSSTSGYTTPAMQCNSTYGGYYNYAAATAGTINNASSQAVTTEASSSICPKGWRLPTSTEINTFDGTSSGKDTYVSQFSPVYSGYYYVNGALNGTGSNGYWWSSTAYSAVHRYYLLYNSGKLYSGSSLYLDRYRGYSVRCVRST